MNFLTEFWCQFSACSRLSVCLLAFHEDPDFQRSDHVSLTQCLSLVVQVITEIVHGQVITDVTGIGVVLGALWERRNEVLRGRANSQCSQSLCSQSANTSRPTREPEE